MGAFGDVSCEYCGERYYEQDAHYCDTQDLCSAIERLQRELEAAKRLAVRLADDSEKIERECTERAEQAERERDEARALAGQFRYALIWLLNLTPNEKVSAMGSLDTQYAACRETCNDLIY